MSSVSAVAGAIRVLTSALAGVVGNVVTVAADDDYLYVGDDDGRISVYDAAGAATAGDSGFDGLLAPRAAVLSVERVLRPVAAGDDLSDSRAGRLVALLPRGGQLYQLTSTGGGSGRLTSVRLL